MRPNSPSLCRWLALAFLAAFLAASCGGSDSAAEAKGPYGSWSEHTTFNYTMKLSTGETVALPAKVVGEKTVADESFPVYQIGTAGSTQTVGGKAYIKKLDDSHFRFAGGLAYSKNTTTPGSPYLSGEVNPPVDLNLDPPLGVDQPLTLTGTLEGLSPSVIVSVSGSYKLISADESVTTGLGVIHHCRHFSAKATLLEKPLEGELWYHEQYGIVAAKVPAYNLDASFAGTDDMGDPNAQSGTNTIRKAGVVSSASPRFNLDTYDRKGLFDADKMTHAQMLVELRWLDEALAKTETRPTPGLTFTSRGGMGHFPSTIVLSPISFFHPEENGQGYVYWVGYVSQAQKNNPDKGGSSYGIAIGSADPNGAVRVTARIVYHLVDPSSGL